MSSSSLTRPLKVRTAVSRGSCCGGLAVVVVVVVVVVGAGSSLSYALLSVFNQSVDVVLGAVFTGGYFKHVRHTKQRLQSVPVCNNL